jgi:hypothetical protein
VTLVLDLPRYLFCTKEKTKMTQRMIKYDFWLRFSRHRTVPHTSKNPPGLGMHDRAMKVHMEVPESVFTRPQMKANITVDHPEQEDMEIDVSAAETALAGVLGCTVAIDVVHPPKEDIG